MLLCLCPQQCSCVSVCAFLGCETDPPQAKQANSNAFLLTYFRRYRKGRGCGREGGREGRIRTEASSFSFMCIISFIHSFTYDHSIIIIYIIS